MPQTTPKDTRSTPAIKDPVVAGILNSVSELMKNRLPYTAGTLALPASAFTLYYKDKDSVARTINLLETTQEELEALTKACTPATFGRGDEDVLDETYRTAGKLDSTSFSTPLVPERTELASIVRDFMLEGKDNTREVEMELYKLNIYGKGSFFKSHVDTPRSERMFGSLVLAFPTSHAGGELILRPAGGTEYTFDSGSILVPGKPRVGYAAFFSDVEHEVLPVTEGHRITLTYNLYYGEERKMLTPESVSTRMSQCRDLLTQLIRNKKVLPKGGLLCFGMKHAYPVSVGEESDSLARAHRMLKGADRLLLASLTHLRLRTNVQLLYRPEDAGDEFDAATGLSSEIIDMEWREWDEESDRAVLARNGTLFKERISRKNVLWVTPPTGLTNIKYAFGQPYGNEVSHGHIYADLCLVSRIAPYAKRLEDFQDEDGTSLPKRKRAVEDSGVGGDTTKRRRVSASMGYCTDDADSGDSDEHEESDEDQEDQGRREDESEDEDGAEYGEDSDY